MFAALVLLTTRAILRDISDILMERVPRSQNAETITAALFAVSHVLLMRKSCMAHLTSRLHRLIQRITVHIHQDLLFPKFIPGRGLLLMQFLWRCDGATVWLLTAHNDSMLPGAD